MSDDSGIIGQGIIGQMVIGRLPGATVALTGVSATTSVGTPSVAFAVSLSGNVALGLAGSVGASAPGMASLIGVLGVGQVGSVSVLFEVGLTGVEVEGNVNTLIPGLGFSQALTGVTATGSVGNLTPVPISTLRGVLATTSVGNLFVLEPPRIDGMTIDSPVILTPRFTGEVTLDNGVGTVGQVYTSQGPNLTPEWADSSGATSSIEQSFTSQTTVTISHNRGHYPQVMVLDETNCIVVPMQVFHSDTDTVVVSFSVAETGTVIIL